jgi:pimeloyl-ACP methyl ester carboxylesterase
VIAWHGLARTGRDMDDIAAHLAQRWRVICPDTLGRGLSQWSPDPARGVLPGVLRPAGRRAARPAGHGSGALAGHLDGRRHRPAAAAGPLRGRIRRLVLNDIGPQLAAPAVERIRAYAGSPPAFATVRSWSSTSAPSTSPTAG